MKWKVPIEYLDEIDELMQEAQIAQANLDYLVKLNRAWKKALAVIGTPKQPGIYHYDFDNGEIILKNGKEEEAPNLVLWYPLGK